MRLDHLLSKEEEVRVLRTVESLRIQNFSGVDALRGHTRSHAVSSIVPWELDMPEVSDPTVRRELPKVEPITGVKS